MEDPQNDFDSVQWQGAEDEQQSGDHPAKAIHKDDLPQSSAPLHLPPDHNADAVDNAGIGPEGYLECTVGSPQKENEGTKDAYISYMITTHVRQCFGIQGIS